jgi:NADH dehydrogenase [ubiquinone] 1 alpha subcomplex assembly factor 2
MDHKLTTDCSYSAQIEPFWHAWMSYAVDTPPNEDPISKTARSWAKPYHIPNWTLTRGAYKPYSTYVPNTREVCPEFQTDTAYRTKPKIDSWEPNALPR